MQAFIAAMLLGLSAVGLSQPYNYTFDPYNATLYQLSDDPYLAFLIECSMTAVQSEGASSGEILRIATQVVPGSLEDYYNPYHYFAQQMQNLSESIDPKVDPAGYRQANFHASFYNRQSVITLVGNASDPRLYDVWPIMQDQFAKAIALLEPAPGLPLNISAKNSSIGPFEIPAYFFKGAAGNQSLPTFIVGTGYDGPMQDLYHFSCAEILKRGVNCMVYEGPGQATPRRAGLAWIADWWSVVTPLVDYLETRPDVDASKIVLLGDSFGGLLAPIAASHEHRLSAMVLLDGYADQFQALSEEFGPKIMTPFNESNAAVFNETIEYALASPEFPTSFQYIWAYTFWGFKQLDPFKAFTALEQFKWGPETAAQIGNLPVYVAKGQDDTTTLNQANLAYQYLTEGRPNGKNLTYFHEFLTALGAGEHTSIGAEMQVYISVFQWLSGIWGGYKFGNVGIE